MRTADPITSHVAALERALRGPQRTRRGMIAEARAGLMDAADAYRADGLPPEQAAARAVRDFGAVGEVAPSFQDELTARQGRHSALLFTLVFPAMLFGWDLLWSSGLVRRGFDPAAPGLVVALARLQDVVTALVGLAAIVLLVATFLRSVPPRRVTRAIGLTGTAGAVVCGGLAVAMNVAGGHSTAVLLGTNMAAVVAFAGSAAVLALIIWQSIRTLRVCSDAA
ncbi:permease prefix domain 1-containing protein [Actinophytocola sp.]|uniref:permease prefix domain 1-containing protein n=1 Tax=Actinophytocola sp. TaxID=1872138 RepID=UPI002ED173CF